MKLPIVTCTENPEA